jgi:hypothetical protein
MASLRGARAAPPRGPQRSRDPGELSPTQRQRHDAAALSFAFATSRRACCSAAASAPSPIAIAASSFSTSAPFSSRTLDRVRLSPALPLSPPPTVLLTKKWCCASAATGARCVTMTT